MVSAACSEPAVSAPPPTTGEPAVNRSEPARAVVTPTGVVAEVLGGEPGAWQVRTPCGGTATVARGRPVTEATVVLDPGHGGPETGAVGADGLFEAKVNLAVADAARRVLEAEGITALLTRTGDYQVSIAVRAALATALTPKAVVSVHHNGGPSEHSLRPGTETYYQHASTDSRRLGGLVYEETVGFFNRHHGVRWHATAAPGAKPQLNHEGGDFFGILRRTAGVPAVLSEALFISASTGEARLLARPDVQQGEGEAIARAVVRFLRTDAFGSGFVDSKPRGPEGPTQHPPCLDPPLE